MDKELESANKKPLGFDELSSKEYEVGDTVVLTGIVGNNKLVCDAEIIELTVIDNERGYVVKSEFLDNRSRAYWYFVRGYPYTCPTCKVNHVIPGMHKEI